MKTANEPFFIPLYTTIEAQPLTMLRQVSPKVFRHPFLLLELVSFTVHA